MSELAPEDGQPATASPDLGHSFRHLAVGRSQTKLTVNQPGDAYEQEADDAADRVMRGEQPHEEKNNPSKLEEGGLAKIVARKKSGDLAPGEDVTDVVHQGLVASVLYESFVNDTMAHAIDRHHLDN